METITPPTYMILGGDGQHYGPITAEQFRAWARDGRVNGQTQVLPTGAAAWCAASAVTELGIPMAAAMPGPLPPSVPQAASDAELEQRIRSGASWFYWIAGMSIVNSILVMSKSGWGFAIGLGLTRETDFALAGSPVIALAVGAVFAGIAALFGFFAIRRHAWAFVIGMVLLLLDTGLTVLQQAWISAAFHGWALVSIFMAFRASRAARRA